MLRGKTAFLFIALLAVVPLGVAADHVAVTVTTADGSVQPGTDDPARFVISVANPGDTTTGYRLNYNGAGSGGWYFLDTYEMTLAPGETRNATLYAEPDETAVAGNYGVIITVAADDGTTVERRPSYSVVRDRDIIITDLTTANATYRPGERFNVTTHIKNVRNRELPRNAYQVTVAFDGTERTFSVPSLIASEPERFVATFTAPAHESGILEIESRVAKLGGSTQDTASAQVQVARTENIAVERDTRFLLATSRTTIAVNNTGNTASNDTTVTAELPAYYGVFTSFDPEPAEVSRSGSATVYTWELGDVPPGTGLTVSYRVNYWAPLLFLLLVAGAVGLGIREYRSPRLVKNASRRGATNAVHLRVRNRSGSAMEDVVVRDTVPSIASLVQKFDASPPEKIRQSGDETEIEWRLGRIEPGDERILTYEVSPQVTVEGTTALPSARLRYTSGNREKERSSSRAHADFS